MNATELAHTNDPQSSHDAAAAVDPSKTEQLFAAITSMLAEKPRAAFQLRDQYLARRDAEKWPKVDPHSVARRLSQLHIAGRVRETGRRVPTPNGATAAVWELS